MRVLLLFRGAPGSGKSTFIDKHGLRPYALSADEIRLQCQSAQQDVYGEDVISMDNEKEVWNNLFRLLDCRMSKGEFTVIDATNSKTSEMNKYKEMCESYRYRMFIVDFTKLPIDECKRRNMGRPHIKRVPEAVIDKMYSRFQNQKIPSGIKVIDPEHLEDIFIKKFDMSKYEKVVHIGDIHGCYTALMEYFKDGLNDNYMYIFLGDFIDRGIENAEVLKFLLNIYNKPNVLMLAGNHECFHKNTEVLTIDGWKNISEIDIETDLVGQFDIDTKKISYAKPIKKINNYAEELIDIESFDMHQVVTPNHDVIYNGDKIKANEFLNMNKIAQNNFILYGETNFEDYNITDDDLRMLVWIVTDGTIYRRKGSIYTRIQFHLSREDKITNIKLLLDKLKIKYSISACKKIENKKQDYVIRIYGDFARYYDNLLSKKKQYPEFFTKLSKRQSLIVLNEIIKTDGMKVSNLKYGLTTINIENANIIQRMCIANGCSCSIRKRDNSGGFNKKGILYALSIKVNGNFPSYNIKVNKLNYKDEVYCLTMPLGTIITRFNGKVAFTGNCHLWAYSNGCISRSKEFEYFTRPQLDDANIDPKDIRQLCRRLGQCAWYTYGDKEIFVSHGGIAKIPDNLGFLSTEQMIKGVGGYDDYMQVVSTWDNTMPSNCYQIFGHRNPGKQPIKIGERVFDLEGNVEFGGDLRIVELSKDGFTPIEIHNTVFKTQEERKKSREIKHSSIADVVMQLRGNKFINEKKYGNISAFNFSKNAFYDGVWNDQTILARGLYINTDLMKITARGFEKFFKINERPETKLGMLKHKLQFPVTCYVKENGFLGLVSYDHEEDDLFITTKSNPEGDFAAWFRCMIYDKLSAEAIETMKRISKEEEVTFVFECVDMHNDPHIIEYPESNVYLLAVIKNQIDFEQWSYEKLSQVASELGVNCKIKGYVLNDWTEFYDWYNEVTAEDYEYDGHKIEGFVIEDADGFMVKVKSWYYNFWKFMRGVAHATLRNGRYPRTGSLDSALANDFYAFCQELYNNTAPENRDLIPRDIVWLRSKFDYWREKNGKR